MARHLTRRQALARATAGGAVAAGLAAPHLARAAPAVRVSHGYSIGYLPLMVMREHGLLEKHAARLGLGAVPVTWQVQDGGNNINDAMVAGALDVAGTGIPGFLVLRDRTRGRRGEMTGICALNSGALWLNTIKPGIRTLADYGPGDRIALPGVKTSYAAVVLQMAAAKEFGIENYAKLDPLTVGLPHPEAYTAMMSGRTEITSHMASPPFSYQELKNPAVRRVLSTTEVVGTVSILLTMTQRAFAEANPGVMQAFVAAQEEANALIASDRDAAVTAYVRASGINTPRADLLEMLADPENAFDVVPSGSQAYADFLARTGVLKARPAAWTELFLPLLHARAGS